jgi:hypothetical protein
MTKSYALNEVEKAMRLLLGKRQIKYIKSRTFTGDSKVQVIRRLVNIGIKTEHAASAYDRGAADSYYGRKINPHYTEGGVVVQAKEGTLEYQEYLKGWSENTDFKDWG